MKDQIYYQYPGCIPFLATFYPPNLVGAFVSSFVRPDSAFVLFQLIVNLHYLLGSVLWYLVFSQWTTPVIALFGALTLTHAAFMIKIQPCVVYTVNWLPGILLDGPLGMVSVVGAILGGYWPYLVYFLPMSLVARLWWGLDIWWQIGGVFLSLPQIIPFLWYWPKSVRAKAVTTGNFGQVPFHRFLNLIKPDGMSKYINGVLTQEMTMYVGFIPVIFACFSQSGAWWVLILAGLGMLGVIPSIGRIPARWTHLFLFALVWLAVSGMTRLNLPWMGAWGLVVLQAYMLLENRRELSYWPFTEWWKKPSEFWGAKSKRTSGYSPQFPYFTGYMTEDETPGYTGGFALQRMHDKYGITDPNGTRVTEFKRG